MDSTLGGGQSTGPSMNSGMNSSPWPSPATSANGPTFGLSPGPHQMASPYSPFGSMGYPMPQMMPQLHSHSHSPFMMPHGAYLSPHSTPYSGYLSPNIASFQPPQPKTPEATAMQQAMMSGVGGLTPMGAPMGSSMGHPGHGSHGSPFGGGPPPPVPKASYGQKISTEILKFGDMSWFPNFVDYTKLRENIKRIVFLEQNPTETITFGEQSLGANAPPTAAGAIDSTGAPVESTPAPQKLRDIFWMLLGQEVSKVEIFYLRAESELAQHIKSDLQLDIRLFDTSEAKEKIKREHESYYTTIVQQWHSKKLVGALSPEHLSIGGSMQDPPGLGSTEFMAFASTLFPSQQLSPQISLMFLQTLKEVHPSLWSNIAQNARTLLPDLLSIVPYLPEASVVELLRLYLRSLMQIERLHKFCLINATIILKLVKLYDSHTKRQTEKAFLARLFAQPLFTSRVLTGLVTYSQELLHLKLLPMKSQMSSSPLSVSRIEAILSDKACPLCGGHAHMPVVLRCQHRVCFVCLAQHSTFGMLCPITGCSYHPTQQRGLGASSTASITSNGGLDRPAHGSDASCPSLDPGDLQVEPVLSKLMAISMSAQQEAAFSRTQPGMLHSPQPGGMVHSPMSHAMGHSPSIVGIGSQAASPMQGGVRSHTHSPGVGQLQPHISPGHGAIGAIGPMSANTSPMSMMMSTPMQSSMQSSMGMHANPHTHVSPMGGSVGSRMPLPMHDPSAYAQMMQAHQVQPMLHAHAHQHAVKSMQQMVYPAPMSAVAASAARARTEVGPRQSCHNCKTMRDLKLLLTCTADPDSARRRKCRKKFCAACISRLYGLQLERMSQAEKDVWICPTCLCVCVCAACKKRDLDNGQPPVVLNPKTGLPLVSPYASSPAYSVDGTFPDISANAPDALTLLASSSSQYEKGGAESAPATVAATATVTADPFSQFRDRDDASMDETADAATFPVGEGSMDGGEEVSAPVAALVAISGSGPAAPAEVFPAS